MEIRFAEDRDLARVRRLWKDCFHDDDAYMDVYFGTLYRPEQTLLLEQGGALAAMLQVLPFTFLHEGQLVSGGYICGACTSEEFRMQGLMRALLEHTLEVIRGRGDTFALLIPAVSGFYEKFGFAFAFQRQIVTLPRAHFFDSKADDGAAFQPLSLREIKAVYEKQAGRFDFFPVRSDAWWDCVQNVYLNDGNICGDSDGYLLYTVKKDKLLLLESFERNEEHFKSMVRSVLLNYPSVNSVEVAEPSGTPYAMIRWLKEPAIPFTRGYLNLMLD